VLGVLPALTTMHAAPAPKRAKIPEIYALVYVGVGKNDPDNAKRIAAALQGLPGSAHRALSDPKVRGLAIVQDKETKDGTRGRNEWAKSKIHAASLEGTAVVRVWFTDGSPQEQVLITDAIAREYVKGEQERFRGALEGLEREKRDYLRDNGPFTKDVERTYRRQEEAIKHLPHVIEWASLPEKP
jgi:hypothetical protein